MARYRKIDPRFWKDEKIVSLVPFEKLIVLYLFTGQSNRIGLFSFSPGEAVEDLGLPIKTFREGFRKVCERLKLGWDEASRTLYLPTWWKYNCPDNPNVLKSCLYDLHEVPKTPLIAEFSANLSYLPETFHQTFKEGLPKPSPKPCPNQEQEQEQEQKTPPLSPSRGDVSINENGWPSPEALVELYNTGTPDECPSVSTISQARRKKALKYLSAFPDRQFWEKVFSSIHSSRFLRGLINGHERFIADFDWLLSKGKDGSENFIKVYDGKYLDRQR